MAPSQIPLVTPDVMPEGSLRVVVFLGKVPEALWVPQAKTSGKPEGGGLAEGSKGSEQTLALPPQSVLSQTRSPRMCVSCGICDVLARAELTSRSA